MSYGLREIMISRDEDETRVVVIEDHNVVEAYIERAGRSVVGNIYVAQVKDILPGMEAAFVDIGLARNAFLYVQEVLLPEEMEEGTPRKKIQHLLKPGQEIMVQVLKDPMGGKGARVTTQITLPGRYLVLMPYSDFTGASRRLSDEDRDRLLKFVGELKPKKMGLIVRTAAEDAGKGELERDLAFLLRLWKKIERTGKESKAPTNIYTEVDLAQRVIRDTFSVDVGRVLIDDRRSYERITSYLKKTSPELVARVTQYKDKMPMFDKYHVNEQLDAALQPRVWLRSGGYITIGKTEALTAIDVNTGKFVGRKSLQDTILRTNMEAAYEVVRQLRLRDIGGIIVIDFIDMDIAEHRQRVFDALEEALEEDRTKTRVIEISKLGLVEMTRKNVSESLTDVMSEECPCCGGTGRVLSDETIRISAERHIRNVCRGSRSQAFLFRVDPRTAELLRASGVDHVLEIQQQTGKMISLTVDEAATGHEVELVMQGKLPQVQAHLQLSNLAEVPPAPRPAVAARQARPKERRIERLRPERPPKEKAAGPPTGAAAEKPGVERKPRAERKARPAGKPQRKPRTERPAKPEREPEEKKEPEREPEEKKEQKARARSRRRRTASRKTPEKGEASRS
ncbi:MAG: Rne/Rng family ribonuclease [Actinobacteria bacterium]|nr:MAG: Rne/Rng family ribonuclease [Actinomycetota bacterium]